MQYILSDQQQKGNIIMNTNLTITKEQKSAIAKALDVTVDELE